ncbi:unnamed protein product [Lactuca saligna]|uniref:Uncharacterized protein n=1 Tax=Lactuca saligna TaxID=75948 RepID=A0AA35Z7S7_LACSI|nr:unnamed protein product [Lactuca saligna]
MDDTLSIGDDHIHDQHEYPKDYEDFGLRDYDSLRNVEFQISNNSNLNIDEDPLEHIQDPIYDNSEYHFGDSSNHNPEQSHATHDYVSPGGSSFWIPAVSDNIKPKINSIFDSYTATLSMYYNYASLANFDVRLGPFRTTESGITIQ